MLNMCICLYFVLYYASFIGNNILLILNSKIVLPCYYTYFNI